MPRCLLVISLVDDFRSAACTIEVVFWQTCNPETDYIKIIKYKSDDIIFTKGNYNQIENICQNAQERINLIASYIKNKAINPLQGMLFE